MTEFARKTQNQESSQERDFKIVANGEFALGHVVALVVLEARNEPELVLYLLQSRCCRQRIGLFEVVCTAKVVTQFGPGVVGKVHALDIVIFVEFGIVGTESPTTCSLEYGLECLNRNAQIPSVLVDSFLELGGEIFFLRKSLVFSPTSGVHFDRFAAFAFN